MNYHHLFRAAERDINVCLLGTGGFGRSFLAQARRIPGLKVRAAVDLSTDAASSALRETGLSPHLVAPCESVKESGAAWQAGKTIATGDLSVVRGLPIDFVIEATGDPHAGARHAEIAIEEGYHFGMVTKELESVAGPEIAHQLSCQGRVATTLNGDQPALLVELITWAETLGLEILSAGKSSEYDFELDADFSAVTVNGQRAEIDFSAAEFSLDTDATPAGLTRRRARSFGMFAHRAVPDLCELAVVANATGFGVDRPELHAPICRIQEVPVLLCPEESGGLLAGRPRLDIFNCLRRPGDISFAGGVFIVVHAEDADTWKMLAQKGHIVVESAKTAMIFNPRHLLGLEAAVSILDAVHNCAQSGGLAPRPALDLVARATEDLGRGTFLAMGGHHHTISGVTAELHPARALGADVPVPFYLCANAVLTRDVAAGEFISLSHIEGSVEDRPLTRLRTSQDARFRDEL